METKKLTIPAWFMNIKYNGRIIPNGKPHDIVATGANCQVFAYHLLRYHNLVVPDFRSSELWTDTIFSEVVMTNYQPLDILFFHKKNNAYGAHLAVYIGNNQAIHNAKKMGFLSFGRYLLFFNIQPINFCWVENDSLKERSDVELMFFKKMFYQKLLNIRIIANF